MPTKSEEIPVETEQSLLVESNQLVTAFEDFAEDVPTLPAGFSREEIYFPEG